MRHTWASILFLNLLPFCLAKNKKRFKFGKCRRKNSICVNDSKCCGDLTCQRLKCREPVSIGGFCLLSNQCAAKNRCQETGLGGVCIPDLPMCLRKANAVTSKFGLISIRESFMKQLKLMRKIKELIKKKEKPDAEAVAELMCESHHNVLGTENVAKEALQIFNKCAGSFNKANIIKYGVEVSAGKDAFRGSLGGGYLYDTNTGEMGCYAVSCLETKVDILTEAALAASIGVYYGESLDDAAGVAYKSYDLQVTRSIRAYTVKKAEVLSKASVGIEAAVGTLEVKSFANKALCTTAVARFKRDDDNTGDGSLTTLGLASDSM